MFSSRFSGLWRQSAIRQALGLLAVFALISTLVWAATYWLVQREMNRLVDARLDAQMTATLGAVGRGDPVPSPGFGQSVALIDGGRVVEGHLPDLIPQPFGNDGFHDSEVQGPGRPDIRYLIRSVDQWQIIVTENTERQEELREILEGGLLAALLASLCSALLAGLWIARRSQTRLDRISDGLAQVAHGDLSARIGLPDRRDDLSLLANRIDATTHRLEQAMEQMRMQSANIAHDLRTPLARLRALVESRFLALVEQNEPVRAEALDAALEQIDRITGTFDALLRISRIKSGARKASFSAVDLAEAAQSVAEAFGPVVEDAGQHLEVILSEPARIWGDGDLVVQLAANLIQNALRYGPEGQTIGLAVHGRRLSVTDQGPGIPLSEREKVFEPLYQMQEERQGEGFGLGLSLVRAISELHGATLTLADGPDRRGLTVTVRFPEFADL